jgi:hypothetical protein
MLGVSEEGAHLVDGQRGTLDVLLLRRLGELRRRLEDVSELLELPRFGGGIMTGIA